MVWCLYKYLVHEQAGHQEGGLAQQPGEGRQKKVHHRHKESVYLESCPDLEYSGGG
jgi:hypothetical protein